MSLPNKLTPAGFPGARVGLETTFFAVDAEEIAARVEDVIHPEPSWRRLVWLALGGAQKLDGHTSLVAPKELKTRIAAGTDYDLPVPFFYESHKRHEGL